MKINPLTQAAGFLRLVQGKGDGQTGRDSRDQRQERREASQEGSKGEKLSDDEMTRAVEKALGAFGADLQAQASGLSAGVEGKGPGLKVVLRDAGGSVVRQFTGDEFLRLREASSKDHRSRGRILDQKF